MCALLFAEIPTQEDKKTTTGTSLAAATPIITSETLTTSSARCSADDSTSHPPSEGSQKPPFGCGCGKCTFFSFIERGCPTPIPSASSFPYLDLSRLTHEQQQELRGRLRFESQQIMIRFQELVSATIKSFKRQRVSLDDLVSHVMTLGAFDPVFKKPQVPLFQYCFQELKAADTIPKVFLVLKDYFSFFNYHIIEHIIKELGTEEDKAELQRYKDDFNQYVKRRIFECRPEFGPINDVHHADIFVKVDAQYENYTVAEIEVFRHKLSEILRVSPQGVLRLCRVEEGCFQLTFQVPSFVQHEIFPLSREQKRALKAEGVIKLTCGEYQFPGDATQDKSQRDIDVIGKFVCGVIPLRVLYMILSHAVDEVEDFEPVQKKPQLDSDAEPDGMCLTSNLHASWLLLCGNALQCIHSLFYITVEEVDVIDLEPARKEKPRLDIDRDSAMGLSLFTGVKSTTLSDVSLLN